MYLFDVLVSLTFRITFQCNYCQKHSFLQSIFLNKKRLSFVYYNCNGTVSSKIRKQDNFCAPSPIILHNALHINYYLHQAYCTIFDKSVSEIAPSVLQRLYRSNVE